MACHTIALPGGVTAIVCGPRGKPPPLCSVCRKYTSSRLCDGPRPSGRGTCSAPLCERCTQHVDPDRDYCPRHRQPLAPVPPVTAPHQPATARCKTCSTPVYWVLTHTGSAMPVDAQPSDNGNLVLARSRTSGQLRSEPYDRARHFGRNRYTSHFATCKDAAQHRRSDT